MQVQLLEMDLGYARIPGHVDPQKFGVSAMEYFYSTPEGFIEASQQDFVIGRPVYRKNDAKQWILVVNGIQWGYVSKLKDATIKLIRRVDEDTQSELLAEVKKLVAACENIALPPAIPESEDEDDEDDDDA